MFYWKCCVASVDLEQRIQKDRFSVNTMEKEVKRKPNAILRHNNDILQCVKIKYRNKRHRNLWIGNVDIDI